MKEMIYDENLTDLLQPPTPPLSRVLSLSPPPTTLQNLDWFVGEASVEFNFLEDKYFIEYQHEVGSSADSFSVQLFQSDCITSMPSDDATKIDYEMHDLSDGHVGYHVDFDPTRLSESAALVGINTLSFCTKLELIDSETEMTISSRKQRTTFTIDPKADYYSVTANTLESDIDSFTLGSLAFYGVEACQCQNSFDCDESLITLDQDTELSICISTISTAVEFRDFDLEIEGNQGFAYEPITYNDSDGQKFHFGTEVETRGVRKRVTTQLLTALFDTGSTDIIINGSGKIAFIEDTTSKIHNEDVVNRAFTLAFSLERTTCLNSIMLQLKKLF